MALATLVRGFGTDELPGTLIRYEKLRRERTNLIQQGSRAKFSGELRDSLTSYEAWYVALAEFLGAKLATLDTRLALAPGPRCGFCLPPQAEHH